MARKKTRRRKSAARHHRKTRVVYRNRPVAHARRRRRTHYRRNPGMGGIVGQAMNLAIGGAIGGVAVVAGEASARLVASRVMGKDPGSLVGGAIQAGTGLVEGIAIEMVLGRGRHRELARQVAHDVVSGVAASLIRTTIKQLNPTSQLVKDALSDGGTRIIPPGRRRLSGYVAPRLNGYVAPDAGLSGFDLDRELGYRG